MYNKSSRLFLYAPTPCTVEGARDQGAVEEDTDWQSEVVLCPQKEALNIQGFGPPYSEYLETLRSKGTNAFGFQELLPHASIFLFGGIVFGTGVDVDSAVH